LNCTESFDYLSAWDDWKNRYSAWEGQDLDPNALEVMRLVGQAAPLAAAFEMLAELYSGMFQCGAAVDDIFSAIARVPGVRKVLLRTASDHRVRNLIDASFRGVSKVGDGSAMDALRFERASGQVLSPKGHFRSIIDIRRRAKRLLRDPNLSDGDRAALEYIVRDANKVLGD
jgi:hypothetical protein